MNVNKYRIGFTPDIADLEFTIPVEQVWDLTGVDDGYTAYEREILESLLNNEDFETNRITHKPYPLPVATKEGTAINYSFFFKSANTNTYVCSYQPKFEPKQIYYFTNQFVSSFWKLDLYDTPNTQTQKNYITIILPVSQGFFEQAPLGVNTVNIRKPYFRLNFVGDKEGFFIYWLKKKNFLDIRTFYMSAKFFDGETGEFVRMINTPQNASSPTTFNPEEFFYYKVSFEDDPITNGPKFYIVQQHPSGLRVGQDGSPINWYEFINP